MKSPTDLVALLRMKSGHLALDSALAEDHRHQLLPSALAENHRHRLELLARQGGRASMVDLLGVTNDSDLRILSYFQGALSRKIRRLLGSRDKRLHLIGWDYDSTEWNDNHTQIVNGDCYITDVTVSALRRALGMTGATDPP